MDKSQLRLIAAGTALGALVGMSIGFVVSQTKKEQLERLQTGEVTPYKPSTTEWIGLIIAAITLIRQIANILTPRI